MPACADVSSSAEDVTRRREERTDTEVRVVSGYMILISLLFIALTLILAELERGTSSEYSVNSPVGWVSVVGAALVFGSTGIPMKSPSLKSFQVDSIVFSLYNSIGIVISTLPLLLYKVATNSFYFEIYGILGAANILVVGYFAFRAVQALGYAIAPALWCGVGMISAFIWGAVVFKEEVNHLVGGIISIVLLAIGVYIMSTLTHISASFHDQFDFSDDKVDDETTSESKGEILLYIEERNEKTLEIEKDREEVEVEDEDGVDNCSLKEESMGTTSQRNLFEGIMFCLLAGLCDGAMMVPFKLSKIDSISTALDYIVSFALASAFVAPVMFCLYCIVKYLSRDHINSNEERGQYEHIPVISFHMHAAFIPGVLSGTLWSLANFLSCHATFYLGMKIGFPLTQTCILFTTCWGIFYFHEIDISPKTVKVTFATGLFLLLTGAYVLSSYG